MTRKAIPTWFFVLVVVRKGDAFLLVHERKHGQLWYLPAGRVEPDEGFLEAARRETLEEAGIGIALDGIIRFEHSPIPDGARVRLILAASPIDATPPKTVSDEESLEARWVTLEEMKSLPLRGVEVFLICSHVARGGAIAPLSLLALEGTPFAPSPPLSTTLEP